MTSLIAWTGIDQRGPASIYIASDSRFTWNTDKWDYGCKLFASTKHPIIFGYCGDVLYPSIILRQLIELIDHHILFNDNDIISENIEVLSKFISKSLESYTLNLDRTTNSNIICCVRLLDGMKSIFQAYNLTYRKYRLISTTKLSLPVFSGKIICLGSGKDSIESNIEKWTKSAVGGTSRGIFSAFCDSLASKTDPFSGGSPQLVGIYRTGSAKNLGIIHNNQRYVYGMCIPDEFMNSSGMNTIEWRNVTFERCDGLTRERLEGAKKQSIPKNILSDLKK